MPEASSLRAGCLLYDVAVSTAQTTARGPLDRWFKLPAHETTVRTEIVAGVTTLLMALLANYPVAVAPAMGHNFYFAFGVVIALKVPWQTALGAVAIAGF